MIPAKLTIEQISFKNTNNDFLIFQVSSNQSPVNLKGLQFFDDKIFKTIDSDFQVKNLDKVKLIFNSAESDNPAQLTLYTRQKGLTATTEQIILQESGQYFDFFCWQQSPISKTEALQFPIIWKENFWDNEDISSCFDSSKVGQNQILTRISPDQKATSWQLPKATINKQKSATANSTTIKTGTAVSAHPSIEFTEIFAAPTDLNTSEWVEIHNLTNHSINLKNWIIADKEGGSKPKRLTNFDLPANGYHQILMKEYKISLSNTSDQIRLFQPNGTLETSQSYNEVEINKSYALISTVNTRKWQYTDLSTPGQPNPVFTTLNAKITSNPQFAKIYSFSIIRTENQENFLVTFDEKTVKAPLAQSTFKPGVIGQFTGIITTAPARPPELSPSVAPVAKDGHAKDGPPTSNQPKILQLSKFHIDASALPENSSLLPILAIILAIIAGIYFLLHKKQSWFHTRLHKQKPITPE